MQREALLAGDEKGYLSVVDPTATGALDGLRVQFRSLRAMQVAAWSDRGYQPSPSPNDEWSVRLNSTPCFVIAVCNESRTPSFMRWRIEDDRAVLVHWEPGDKDGAPWQTDELVALAGARTVVATTPSSNGSCPCCSVRRRRPRRSPTGTPSAPRPPATRCTTRTAANGSAGTAATRRTGRAASPSRSPATATNWCSTAPT
ncbi:hypothetical protein ACFQZ4_22205 [Catellatospora coxensis]